MLDQPGFPGDEVQHAEREAYADAGYGKHCNANNKPENKRRLQPGPVAFGCDVAGDNVGEKVGRHV